MVDVGFEGVRGEGEGEEEEGKREGREGKNGNQSLFVFLENLEGIEENLDNR